MLQKYSRLSGFAGLVLIGVYSLVMMTTSGSAGWAWLILLAGIVLVVMSARGGLVGGKEGQDG